MSSEGDFLNGIKISVIVPVYNVGKYLNECMDSIINQTFTDIEIICINDGSTDNSLSILEYYAGIDDRVTIISQDNRGLSSARNTGLKNACGKYVYFIDSDDYIRLNALQRLYNLAEEKSLDLILFKQMNFNDDTGQKFSEPYFDMPYLRHLAGKVFDYEDIKDDVFTLNKTVYSKFFTMELIGDSKFLEGHIFEDNLFLVDYIFDAKRIYFYDEYLYCRRVRPDSLIAMASKNHADVITIFNKTIERLKKRNLYDYYRYIIFNQKISVTCLRYSGVREEFKEYFFDKFRDDCLKYKKECETDFDFRNVTRRNRFIFDAVLESRSYQEFDAAVKKFDSKK